MTWTDYWEQIITGTQGQTGTDGALADYGPWVAGAVVHIHDRYTHTKSGKGRSVYRAKTNHTAVAGAGGNEPEVATSWATHWELWAEGGTNGAGAGDTIGPASSVTDNLAAFYDTGGKQLKDSLIPKTQVNFNSLTESTLALVADTDFVCAYIASLGAYRKVSARKFGRKTESIIIPAQAFWKRISNPCGDTAFQETTTTNRAISYMPFPDGAATFANCNFFTPKNYDGLSMTIRFFWFLHTTTVGTVAWGAYAHCTGDDESLDGADTTAASVVDTSHGAVDYLMISDSAALLVGGSPGPRKHCVVQILRNPALDTLGESAYFAGVEIEYGVTE